MVTNTYSKYRHVRLEEARKDGVNYDFFCGSKKFSQELMSVVPFTLYPLKGGWKSEVSYD
jgi:hypothetical protein